MRWSERQREMLAHMGIRLFEAPPEARAQALAPAPAAAPTPPTPPTPPTRPTAPAVPVLSPAAVSSPLRSPRPSGTEAMAWPELREAVASCRACGLCEGRSQTVFGMGHEGAHWMIVGEAPGEQEDREGLPFVGKSGQLLDNMLRAVGLTRQEAGPAQQVYIANTVKCRPPGNRNPLPEELAQCEPFLLRQIALVQPKLILALGRFAVQSLLRSSEPIGRLRGQVHQYQGVPLVVSYHPAYLLRNPQDKARAWDDLCIARELLQSSTQSPT
jgi:uracil-DNA glycosylase